MKLLYKKDLKTETKNFRPIPLFLLISKITGRIIHDQTMNFHSDTNVLYKYQSGFEKFHSADTRLSYLHGKTTKGFDSGLLIRIVLIDLQRAFDIMYHNIVIKKKNTFLGFTDTKIK